MEKAMKRFYTLAVTVLALGAAPALAAGIFGSDSGGTPPAIAARINKSVPASLVQKLEKASKSGLSLAPDASVTNSFRSISGPRINKGAKVGVLYVGADFCPYCAGQRWALLLTLVRFGHFTGLEYMASSPHDAYANTPTFSFQNATYKSDYIDFQAVETTGRNGEKLQSLNNAQNAIFNKFDAPPYSPGYGNIPFVYVDGRYLVTRPLLLPNELSGMDWDQIAAALGNPQSNLFQSVMPQVNTLTAAICQLDGGNPDDVCSAPGVTGANAMLFHLSSQQGD